ncbi:MAG: metallophosphoesterase [Spirochaetota bacterium]
MMLKKTLWQLFIVVLSAYCASCTSYGPYKDIGPTSSWGTAGPPQFSGSTAPGKVRFLVLSDSHGYDKENLVLSQKTWARHLVFWGKNQDTGFVNTAAVLAAAGRGQLPDFIVLPGDLTVDGELASHQMLAGFLDGFRVANPSVPVYVTTGNHDVNSPQARRHGRLFTVPTLSVSPAGFASVYNHYGFLQALSRDTESLSYVVEPVPGLALLMLDTASWHKNMYFPIRLSNTKGLIRESTLDWMEQALAEARRLDMMIVVVQHHPLAAEVPGSKPESRKHEPRKPDPMNSIQAAALYRCYDVALMVTGHRHQLNLDLGATMPRITAPSLASSPAYAMLVSLGQDGVTVQLDPYGFGAPEGHSD